VQQPAGQDRLVWRTLEAACQCFAGAEVGQAAAVLQQLA